MMKKIGIVLLSLAVITAGAAQESGVGRRPARHPGDAAGYSSRNATILSMMGWGFGLGIAIAAICALIDNNTGAGGGGGNHVHGH